MADAFFMQEKLPILFLPSPGVAVGLFTELTIHKEYLNFLDTADPYRIEF